MNFMKMGAALVAAMALVACNSTTDSAAGNTGGSSAPSTIFDLNLPADFDRSALPGTAQNALAEFERRNAGTVATGGPAPNASGNFVFFGNDSLGVAVEDGAGGYSLVQGDVFLEGNVNTALVGGQFQNLRIIDAGGNTSTVTGEVRLLTGSLQDGRFSNALSTGTGFRVDGVNATVTGNSQGAFVGDGSEALGIVGGSITIGTEPAQGFVGGYTADQL